MRCDATTTKKNICMELERCKSRVLYGTGDEQWMVLEVSTWATVRRKSCEKTLQGKVGCDCPISPDLGRTQARGTGGVMAIVFLECAETLCVTDRDLTRSVPKMRTHHSQSSINGQWISTRHPSRCIVYYHRSSPPRVVNQPGSL